MESFSAAFVAGRDGAADTLVYLVDNQLNFVRMVFHVAIDGLDGRIAAQIVNDINPVHEIGHGVEHGGDQQLLVKAWYNDADC